MDFKVKWVSAGSAYGTPWAGDGLRTSSRAYGENSLLKCYGGGILNVCYRNGNVSPGRFAFGNVLVLHMFYERHFSNVCTIFRAKDNPIRILHKTFILLRIYPLFPF